MKRFMLAAVVIFSATLLYADDVRGSFDRTLKVSGPVELRLENGSGAVHVRGGPAGTVTIHAEVRVRGGNAEEKLRRLEQNPPIVQTGNSISVGQNLDPDLRRNAGLNYDIVVPADTRVDVHTGSGNEEVSGIKGPVNARTGSGAVRITDVPGEVTVDTGSGGVELENIGTLVRAHTGSGSVRADLSGTRSGNGPRTTVETGSGSIELQNVHGGLYAHTGSGHVSVSGEPTADWDVHTGSGGVELNLPSDAAFDLAAHTGSGHIKVDHPIIMQGAIGNRHNVEGKVRGGGPRLEVRTGSGGIYIASGGSQPL